MSSDNKDDKKTELTTNAEQKSLGNEEFDLDKNPIKFATHEPGKFDLNPHDKSYMELVLRNGKHSDLVKKILRQRIELRAKEFPRWPGDSTGGVRVVWAESRFWYDRERLGPDFDDEWRSYRARYLHSLELDPREPVHVPEYEKILINPIRRFYQRGGDMLEKFIYMPITRNDKVKSALIRSTITRYLMTTGILMSLYYWMRYNGRSWITKMGPEVGTSQPIVYMYDNRWPYNDPMKEPAHYYIHGFSKRTIYKDLNDYEDTTVVL